MQSTEQLMAPKRSATVGQLPQLRSSGHFEDYIRQLSALFVEALTEGGGRSWSALLNYFDTITPDVLSNICLHPVVQHYAHRAVQCAVKHPEALGRVDVCAKFASLFPNLIDRFRNEEMPSYAATPPRSLTASTAKRHHRSRTVGSELQQLLDSNTSNIPLTFRAPLLKLSELDTAARDVFDEITGTKWKQVEPFPLKQAATNPVSPPPPPSLLARKRPLLEPVFQSPSTGGTLPGAKRPSYGILKQSVVGGYLSKGHFETVHDVIEAFATGKIPSESESVYLNYSKREPWNPYFLQIVPKTKAELEHFIASKFGLLHVYPDGENDLQSFADWSREASMFCLLHQIPFFRQYRLRKALWIWHRNARRHQFNRLCFMMENSCVKFYPIFRDGLLKVQHLCEELSTVSFYTLTPLGDYSLTTYDNELSLSKSKAQAFLGRYFKYCSRVITEVVSSVQGLVSELEKKRNHCPLVCDLPLSVQRENHARMEREVQMAQHRASKIGSYIALAEHIVVSCLVQLARKNANEWLQLTLQPSSNSVEHEGVAVGGVTNPSKIGAIKDCNENDTALLCIHIRIDKGSGTLIPHPSAEVLNAIIMEPLSAIPEFISSVVRPLFIGTSPLSTSSPGQAAMKMDCSLEGTPCQDQLESYRPRSKLASVKAVEGSKVEAHPIQPLPTLLTAHDIRTRLHNDDVLACNTKSLSDHVGQENEELKAMCTQYNWLCEVNSYILTLEDGAAAKTSPSAQEFESCLSKLHFWRRSLEGLPSKLVLGHRLLLVELSGVTLPLLSRLSAALVQVQGNTLANTRNVWRTVLDQAKCFHENMCSTGEDLEGIAHCVKLLKEAVTFQQQEATKVTYILSVHQTLSRYGVEVPAQDRSGAQELKVVWESFEGRLKEASQFVAIQIPLKAAGLQESISLCEEEMKALIMTVSHKPFTDPSAVPSAVIGQIKEIQEKLISIRARMMGLSKWKEAITDKPQDHTEIASLMDSFFVRHELWKYRKAYDTVEREWMKTPFKKLEINILAKYLKDSLKTCCKLQAILPPKDAVLEAWRARLLEFQDGIPLLEQLSSKSLKASHWQTIFAALGQDYNHTASYTLTDFSSYNIFEHSDIIAEICHDALQEEKVKHQVTETEERWEQMTIVVSPIPLEMYPFAFGLSERQRGGATRKAGDKTTTFSLDLPSTQHSTAPHKHSIFTVSNDAQVLLMLEDNITSLKTLLNSPHSAGMRPRIESMLSILRQLGELFMSLVDGLRKWLDLLALFSSLEESLRPSYGLETLQVASENLQEVMGSIREDPRVLSLLSKKRGQTGVRDLQGESLRANLDAVHGMLSSLLSGVHLKLSEASAEFPRLFYLSPWEALRVLSHRGSPASLVPLISRIFPAITTIHFTEVAPSESYGHEVDEGFQVISVEGPHDQCLKLVQPLPLGRKPSSQWMRALETAVAHSLACQFTECQAAMPGGLFSQLAGTEPEGASLKQWLSGHLIQSVAMVTHVTWDQAIQNVLIMQNKSLIAELRTKLTAVISVASKQLRLHYQQAVRPSQSLMLALQTFISILNHKLTLLQSVLKNGEPLPLHYSLIVETHPPAMQSSSRHTLKGSYVGLGEQSLLPRPLDHSSQSLVASSKSLRSSRYSLSSSELQNGKAAFPQLGETSPSGPSPARCVVHCGDMTVPYGYELCIPGEEPMVSLATESCVVSLAIALSRHEIGILNGEHPESKVETTFEMAKILGRHCYQFQCEADSTQHALVRVLAGAVFSGHILLLRSCDSLQLQVLIPFGKVLHDLYQAIVKTFENKMHPLGSNTREYISLSVSSIQMTQSHKTVSCFDWYKMSSEKRTEDRDLDWEMMGTRVKMSPSFGCVMVLGGCGGADIPGEIKGLWRPVELVIPPNQYIAETFLLSFGYSEAASLSKKLTTLIEHIKSQLGPIHGSLNTLRGILSLSRTSLTSRADVTSEETCAIYHAVVGFFRDRLSAADMETIRGLFRSTFPGTELSESHTQAHDFGGSHDGSHGIASESPGGSHEKLREAIHMQLSERHLQQLSELIEKMVQLHQSLQGYRCVALCGPAQSGKTTTYNTLASAYRHLTSDRGGNQRDFPLINITVLNTAAYTAEQLFGSFQKSGQWKDGIVTRMFNQLHEHEQLKSKLKHPDNNSMASFPNIKHWLVLDGPLGMATEDYFASLLSEHGVYHLPNGSSLTLPACCQLLLKMESLDGLCPSLLHHSAIVHFRGGGVVSYEALINTWLERAPTHHNLTSMSVEILASMIKGSLPEAMEFISSVSQLPGSSSSKMTLTRSLLALLSALLKRGSPSVDTSTCHTSTSGGSASHASSRPVSTHTSLSSLHAGTSMGGSTSMVGSSATLVQHTPASDDMSEVSEDPDFHLELTSELQMASVFAMAYIWSMAGYVPFSQLPAFNDFARSQLSQLLYTVPLPEEGSLFDYCLDLNTYQFIAWTARNVGKRSSSGQYAILPEVERFAYLTDLYLSYGLNVVIIGDHGTGKTTLVEHLIQTRTPLTKVTATSGLSLSSLELQRIVTDKISQLQKRTGPQKSKHSVERKSLFFIDDLHLVSSQGQGELPSVTETLRYMISSSVIMDPVRNYKHSLYNVQYIATCSTSDVPHLDTRMMAAFHRVPLLPPTENTMFKIFLQSIRGWVDSFSIESIAEPLAEAIAAASVISFCSLASRYSPTLSKPHLSLTMHDLMHVSKGLLLLSSRDKMQALPQLGAHGRHRGGREKKPQPAGGKTSKKGKTEQAKDGGLAKLRGKSQPHPSPSKASTEVDQQRIVQTVRVMVRLWCHESTRVYADRMIEDEGRSWFQALLEGCVRHCFCGAQESSGPQGAVVQSERRGRGGRGRANVPQQTSGLSVEELSKMGIKMGLVQKLIPPDPEVPTLRQLISVEQVSMKGEDLTGLMFAKFPSPAPRQLDQENSDVPTTRGSSEVYIETSESLESHPGVPYGELGDGQVMEIVRSHLNLEKGDEVVPFKAALEHITRLCRVMASRGCHGLLLGPRGTGRRSLVGLSSRVMNAKLFTCNQSITGPGLKKCLKDVCMSAGLERENTILVVSKNADDWNKTLWEHVCQIMGEGLSPGLFSSSELLVMGSKVQANRLKKTVENSYQEFAASVHKHLHIFVVWDTQFGSPFSRDSKKTTEDSLYQEECERAVFALVCKYCIHIDCYHPWSKLSYGDIALHVWQDSTCPRWEEWTSSPSQLEALSLLAAHVHITSMECLYCSASSRPSDLISPGTFIECLNMTKKLAVKLIMEQKQKAEKLQAALDKLKELDEIICTLQRELDVLRPLMAAAEQDVQQRMALITAAKERYMAASKRCRDAEETIQTETKNVELFEQVVKEKFDAVAPLYQSSLEVLSSVTTGDILELMSYRVPPPTLEPVFHALCMLFDRPQTWEDCKQLLLTQNFCENLKFFDKDNVANYKIQRLEKIIAKTSKFEGLEEGSKGIVPLCNWLVALVNYHRTNMAVEPLRQKLKLAENKRLGALETFVSMRKDMEETKKSMEETMRSHKESVQKAANIENNIADISSQLSRANDILLAFAEERHLWNEKLQRIHDYSKSAPGHALLSAANICYLQCVSAEQHQALMKNWVCYCHGVIPFSSLLLPSEDLHPTSSHQPLVTVQNNFSVCEVFSSQEERDLWRKDRIFFDPIVHQRVLAARAYSQLASSRWPLVCDPHKQFCQLLKVVEEGPRSTPTGTNTSDGATGIEPSPRCVIGRMSDQSFPSKLVQMASEGGAGVLILDVITSNCDHEMVALLHKGTAPIHPNFRLYVVIERHLEDMTVPLLLCSISLHFSSFAVVNLDLATSGLCNYYHRLIMDWEKPGYSIRMKSMETDWTLHHQQLEKQQDAALTAVCTLSDSLLASSSVVQTLAQCKATEASTVEHISETTKAIESFQHQAQLYTPLAQRVAIVFKVAQQLCSALKYLSFDVMQFEALLFDVAGKERVLDHTSAIQGHVLHAMRKLGVSVHTLLQRKTLRRHHLLFPLLLGLEVLLSSGQASLEEVQLLGQTSEPMEEMIDLCLQSEVTLKGEKTSTEEGPNVKRPHWITLKTWCSILKAQSCVPALKTFSQLLSENSEEWKEYLKFEPSYLDSLPHLRDLSLLQKLLIWKILKPEMFYQAVCQFVTLLLGAEFTRAHFSNVASLISELPQRCICLLQEQDVGKASKVFTSTLPMEFQRCSVTSDRDMESLQATLPQLIARDVCVLVEHLHHCDGWTEKLKELLKVFSSHGGEINSKFKLWIILPVNKVADLEMNGVECSVAVMEIDDEERPLAPSERSSQLIDDFKVVQDANFTQKLLPWENYETLITKLMQLVPALLPETEHDVEKGLHDLESRHGPKPQQQGQHPFLSPITKELHKHNFCAAKLQRSLVALRDTLNGKKSFTCSTTHTLTAILQNCVPSLWNYLTDIVPAREAHRNELKLLPLLQLHRHRVLFYNDSIQRGCPTPTVNILWFSKPNVLTSVLCQCFADKHKISLEDIYMQAELSATEPKEHGAHYLVLNGTKLSRAKWNEREHYLECTDLEQDIDTSQMLFIIFEAIPGVPPKGWKCPIYYPVELGCASLQAEVPLDVLLTVFNDSVHDACLCCDMPLC